MTIAAVIALIVILMIVFRVKRSKNTSSAASVADSIEVVPTVSVEVMDQYFKRDAGRFCDHCGIHGSHHTDRHDIFVAFIMENKQKTSRI